MVQGFDRREVVQYANSKSKGLDPASVPLSPVMRPQPSSFAKVGEADRQLAEALGQASIGLGKYVEKKKNTWMIEGQMARARGVTEEEIAKSGNSFTTAGWQVMDGKLAQDALLAQEEAYISSEGKMQSPDAYQKRLSAFLEESNKAISDKSPDAKEMLFAGASELFPKLVAAQTRAHNEYNKAKTIDTGRQLLASTGKTEGPEAASQYLDKSLYNLNDEEYSSMVATALIDNYGLKDNSLEKAVVLTGENKFKTSNFTTKNVNGLLNLIGHGESRNNYNAVYGGENQNLTGMTLDEVLGYQGQVVAQGSPSSAVGKYQIIRSTLEGLKTELGLTGAEPFDETLQDTLAMQLLKRRGVEQFLSGGMSAEDFQFNLSQEWAALPKDKSGLSFYDGDGLNRATLEPGEVLSALAGDQAGGSFYDNLVNMGMRSDDISRVMKARESYESEKSSEFNASRLLEERAIEAAAVDLSDEDLIKRIETTKENMGFSDQWANQMWNSALSQRKSAEKERKDAAEVNTAIAMNSLAILSPDKQDKAIAQEKQRMMNTVLSQESLSPQEQSQQVRSGVADFVVRNNVVDRKWSAQIDAALSGNIIDKEGKVSPEALQAYEDYLLLAKTGTGGYADKYVPESKELVALAASYDESGALSTESSLRLAAEIIQRKRNDPNWVPEEANPKAVKAAVNKWVESMDINWFQGISGKAYRSKWNEVLDKEIQSAKSDPRLPAALEDLTTMHIMRGMHPKAALKLAQGELQNRAEFVMGNVVLSGKESTIRQDMGIAHSSEPTAVNKAITEYLQEYGEDMFGAAYKDAQSQWIGTPEGSKLLDKVGSALTGAPAAILNSSKLRGRNVPNVYVTYNAAQKGFMVDLYTNTEKTRVLNQPVFIPANRLGTFANERIFKPKAWYKQAEHDIPKSATERRADKAEKTFTSVNNNLYDLLN